MPAKLKDDHGNQEEKPQAADGYAAAIDEFLGQLNASTSRSGGGEHRKLSRADFLACLNHTFSTVDGKIVLAWLHATAGTRKPAFVFGGAGDSVALAAATRDGRRGLVWEIEANLEDARSNTPAAKPAASGSPRVRRTGKRGA
jgi:hypothetical protein